MKDEALLRKLDDYLNFFEFIAYLWKRKELTGQEVRAVFDYSLGTIAGDAAVLEYIRQNQWGYEGLRELLDRMGYTDR